MTKRSRSATGIGYGKPYGKPWLLLWLLPYLVLTLANGGAHNHAFVVSGSNTSAQSMFPLPPIVGSLAPNSLHAAKVSALHLQLFDHAECPACHWAATAFAFPGTQASVPVPQRLALFPPPHIHVLTRNAALGRYIRGPPFRRFSLIRSR